MVKLKNKYNGSTLVETLVALVIVMLCFGIGTTVFLGTASTMNSHKALHARFTLDSIARNLSATHRFQNGTVTTDGFNIEISIDSCSYSDKLVSVQLVAHTLSGRTLARHFELMHKKP